MTRREIAVQNFKDGYNCAQSVVLAFADKVDLSKDDLLRIASGFGGGMGRLREVCGAVSGMFMVGGLIFGYSSPDAKTEKIELYKNIQKLAEEFKINNGSIICRELLGTVQPQAPEPEVRTAAYYQKRPCAELVGDAAEILEKFLTERGK